MLNTDLDRKIFMAQSFLDVAAFLEMVPNFARGASVEEAQADLVYGPWRKKSVIHFLYSIVFEISIKIIWEIEQKENSPHHHNIFRLYKELSSVSQQKISDMYDSQVSNMKKLISEVPELTNYNWDLQSLEDALKVNETVIKNFKYDGEISGKSSVFGSMLWADGEILTTPQVVAELIIFPKALFNYAISLKN